MTSVGHFAQYLLKQDPQRNPARLTLLNFLKYIVEPDVALTAHVIQAFYARALQFEHWARESDVLSETVRTDLHEFSKAQQLDLSTKAWQSLRHPDNLQLVPIRIFSDFDELVQTELAARRKSGDEMRILSMSDNQTLVLLLSPDNRLEARVYPQMAMVWGARLTLVTPVTQLFYGPDLELLPHARQVLEGTLLTTHCFQVDHEGAHGLITRGHTFQKFETFMRARLSDTMDLFESLKRVERHFINPQSDSHYQELVSRLERANRLLAHPTAENLIEAERALNRGRSQLKHVFPNDRLLTLLVTHLDYGITQRRKSQSRPAEQISR